MAKAIRIQCPPLIQSKISDDLMGRLFVVYGAEARDFREDREKWDEWDEWEKWEKWEIPHQALAIPSIPSSEALPIKL